MEWQLGGSLNGINHEVYMTDVDKDVEFCFARGTTHKQLYRKYVDWCWL